VVAVSVSAHAALFLAVPGHVGASAMKAEASAPAEVEIEVAHVVDTPEAAALPNRTAEWPAHVHTHTHPYPVPPGHDATPHDPSLVHGSPAQRPSLSAPSAPGEATPAPTAAPDATPRFTITISDGAPGEHAAAGVAPSVSPGAGGTSDDDGPVGEEAVDLPARLLRGEAPVYPADARADGVEADVGLELVVSREGSVESALVTRPAGHGMDRSAIAAAQGFRFTPAQKSGRAVRVRLSWTVRFRLQ
jgi:protein TonB